MSMVYSSFACFADARVTDESLYDVGVSLSDWTRYELVLVYEMINRDQQYM